jgi:hypothetical protein
MPRAMAGVTQRRPTELAGGDALCNLVRRVVAMEDSDMINKADLQRFVDWTFERELTLLEGLVDDFDRNSPTADPDKAHCAALLSYHDQFPRLLSYDMHWWANLCRNMLMQRDGSLPSGLLDHLGIRDAVLAWINDEALWLTQRAAARRSDRKQRRMQYKRAKAAGPGMSGPTHYNRQV